MKIRNYHCLSFKDGWAKLFVSFHLHSNLHFENQVKIAKLMSHSIYYAPVICVHGPPTYGDSRGIAGLMCRAITF